MVNVVDNSATPDRTVTATVTIVDKNGNPVSGERVELEDRGGTPDDRFGSTDTDGKVRFLENVGPPPCNRQTVILPDRGMSQDLGCNNGGVTLEARFEVQTEGTQNISKLGLSFESLSSSKGNEVEIKYLVKNLIESGNGETIREKIGISIDGKTTHEKTVNLSPGGQTVVNVSLTDVPEGNKEICIGKAGSL